VNGREKRKICINKMNPKRGRKRTKKIKDEYIIHIHTEIEKLGYRGEIEI